MIHVKSLIRRLDCVPWLLAACALVWAGEATAQITLSLSTYEINERQGKDGASVDLVVTAKATAAAAGDAFFELSVDTGDDGTNGNDERLSIDGLGRLKIPDTKDSGELTLKVFPRDNGLLATAEGDITITVDATHVSGGGYAAATADVTETMFRLVDDDVAPTLIRLTVDMQDLKDEGDAMDIKVTATLDGMKITSGVDLAATGDGGVAAPTLGDNKGALKLQLAAVELTDNSATTVTAGSPPLAVPDLPWVAF